MALVDLTFFSVIATAGGSMSAFCFSTTVNCTRWLHQTHSAFIKSWQTNLSWNVWFLLSRLMWLHCWHWLPQVPANLWSWSQTLPLTGVKSPVCLPGWVEHIALAKIQSKPPLPPVLSCEDLDKETPRWGSILPVSLTRDFWAELDLTRVGPHGYDT
jgi:hypothetical protein